VPPRDVDDYIAAQPTGVQERLRELRAIIREAVPQAAEVISYGMPTYRLGHSRLHFGAAKRHCALYGVGTGTVRFPLDQPIPAEQVRALVVARLGASG
jgi:uncharacterized protein YdhG (YjbR/CyaY superfamily)